MYQNYNYYPQQNPQMVQQQQQLQYQPQIPYLRQAPPQTVGLKGRLVSSLEEARATSIDFDGSIFIFPDLANRRIYTKQINMDGTATLNVYELRDNNSPIEKEETLVAPALDQFVTKEEFERVIAQLRQSLIPQKTELVQPTNKEILKF